MRIVAQVFAGMALVVGLASSPVSAADVSPVWRDSYAAAYQAGKASHRPVLVVIDKPAEPAYRVTHVSSERKASAAEAALLANYELCHIDATTEYGQKIAGLFNVKQYPHVAITDRQVNVLIYEKSGQMSGAEWQAALVKHRRGEIEAPPVICTT